ncbi:uncharacterized protein LOC131599478 [Vicia villosa]|uniref:uncharacterized protein LOC131599478 n=1 Tax=Vicia villosa TaxID=3911 RepID=UPI00273AB52C|nr:uncharacterized protein LOC131599478 [Vicia villosa]
MLANFKQSQLIILNVASSSFREDPFASAPHQAMFPVTTSPSRDIQKSSPKMVHWIGGSGSNCPICSMLVYEAITTITCCQNSDWSVDATPTTQSTNGGETRV